jgi:hypothetical protein
MSEAEIDVLLDGLGQGDPDVSALEDLDRGRSRLDRPFSGAAKERRRKR